MPAGRMARRIGEITHEGLIVLQKQGAVLEEGGSMLELGAPDHLASPHQHLSSGAGGKAGPRGGTQRGTAGGEPGVRPQSAHRVGEQLVDPMKRLLKSPEGRERRCDRVGQLPGVPDRAPSGGPFTRVVTTHRDTAQIAGNTITYTPAPDFFGSDQFTYTIGDGHGGVINDALAFVAQYIAHRKGRENSILARLAKGDADIPTLVRAIYIGIDPRLVRAAGLSVFAHLEDMADRVGGEDFRWVVMAINIQRQVGGNLAQLLNTVAETLRERERVRRQIKVLSAEGKLSAYILVALPFGLFGYLMLVNPEYIGELTGSTFGRVLIVGALVLMGVGSVWMRKIIKIDV